MTERRREIGIAVGVAIALAVLVGVAAIYFFPSAHPTMQSGRGNPGTGFVNVFGEYLSCSLKNDSCELVVVNTGVTSEQATGCEFQDIYSTGGTGGSNQSRSFITAEIGPGVLSYAPKGAATTLVIGPGATEIVYCTDTAQSMSSLSVGAQAAGTVIFSDQKQDVGFSGLWKS